MKNKRIEETAINALKTVLLRCETLDSFIGSNDKTPSWDGSVFVYRNESQKNDNLIGRVPIQVKGTEKVMTSDYADFSCRVYCRILFVIINNAEHNIIFTIF